MKKLPLAFLALALGLFALPACNENKPLDEKIKDGVNDALDQRPGEKVRDAAEDVGDAVKDAAHEVKDAVKDATN